jgi:hypothetical protein
MKKKIALVCVAKEEDYYLQEWIDYHLKIGFDDIHIFQNEWRFKNPIPNDRVHFHEWDVKTYISDEPIWKKNLQAKCYTDFAVNYNEQYEWAAFFDVDEFLVLKETNDVKTFIDNYSNHDCLVVSWALFGDNGIKDFDETNTSCIKRFTKRWNSPHTEGYYQFKSICKLHKDMVHNTHWHELEWVDTNYNKGNGAFNYNVSYDKAQLNHYYTKTHSEWINKNIKSRADIPNDTERFYTETHEMIFNQANFNDVEDLHALNFFKN